VAAPRRHLRTFAAAAAAVLALDQLTKHWALQALDDGPIDLVGSLRLNLVFNDRAAFSLGFGSTTAIALIGLVLVTGLVWMGLRAEDRTWALGLGVILGGALGNLTDRAFRAGDGFLGGRVVDMVDLQWWPVFNLADVALWVGIAILFLASRSPAAEAAGP
jgi:signal peptidase II